MTVKEAIDFPTQQRLIDGSLHPALLSAVFTESGDFHIALQLRSNNAPDVVVTVIHDANDGETEMSVHDLVGTQEASLIVQDGECLVIVARQGGAVIGDGTYIVATSLIESLGRLLFPCVEHALFVDQCDSSLLDHATSRALVAACDALTDELAETAQVAL